MLSSFSRKLISVYIKVYLKMSYPPGSKLWRLKDAIPPLNISNGLFLLNKSRNPCHRNVHIVCLDCMCPHLRLMELNLSMCLDLDMNPRISYCGVIALDQHFHISFPHQLMQGFMAVMAFGALTSLLANNECWVNVHRDLDERKIYFPSFLTLIQIFHTGLVGLYAVPLI